MREENRSTDEYDKLPWWDMESTNISRVAWVPRDWATDRTIVGSLWIQFKSSPEVIYEYIGVSSFEYAKLCMAESTGKFFNSEIRGKYDEVKVNIYVPVDVEE